MSAENWRAIARSLSLSNRELEVVRGVFNGGNEASIADDLSISTHTIHSHFDRLYRKLGIKSRSALIIRVFAEYLKLEPRPPQRDRASRRRSSRRPRVVSAV